MNELISRIMRKVIGINSGEIIVREEDCDDIISFVLTDGNSSEYMTPSIHELFCYYLIIVEYLTVRFYDFKSKIDKIEELLDMMEVTEN